MSDTPRIVQRDPNILSLEDARDVQEGKRQHRPVGKAGDLITRQELYETVKAGQAKAAVAVGQKMYDQISGEMAVYLQQMEVDIAEALWRRIENDRRRRSLYGRFRTLLIRLGAKPKQPELVVDDEDPPAILDGDSPDLELAPAESPAETPAAG